MVRNYAPPELPPLSQRQFAAVLGVTSKTVTNWCRKGCPAPKKDPAGAFRWAFEHAAGDGFTDQDARKRWELARAEKMELSNARTRGELLPACDMKVIAAESGAIFAGGLSGLPSRMASELAGISDPAVIRDRLRLEVTRIRKTVYDKLALLGSLADG